MSSNTLLEEPPVYQPSVHENLSDLVETYSAKPPRAEWLTKLALKQPRENLTCLPLSTRFFKRVSDIVIASTMLIALSPVMLLTALLVKLTSPGGIIYACLLYTSPSPRD